MPQSSRYIVAVAKPTQTCRHALVTITTGSRQPELACITTAAGPTNAKHTQSNIQQAHVSLNQHAPIAVAAYSLFFNTQHCRMCHDKL